MTATALERAPARETSLFPGATAGEIITVAADVAQQFSDVVRQQRMFKRIGENDHIQIEAWQTIGALTGVLADEGVVTELPWPTIEPLGDEPPYPEGREPRSKDTPEWRAWNDADRAHRHWELHRDLLRARATGAAFGFKAEFRTAKQGTGVGWGEGRCNRREPSKVNQEDYALASMAQTRGQSRALGAPLKFVVKLAGYETTPAEELDGNNAAPQPPTGAAAGPAAPWGPVASDEQENAMAAAVRRIAPAVDAEQFVLLLGQGFDGVPVAAVKAITGLAKFIAMPAQPAAPAENAPPPADQSAYHQPPPAQAAGPPDDVVYPPGHYHGD